MTARSNRELLKQANPSKKWAEKVDSMSSSQVASQLAALKSQKKI